jgi:hypothetical protein
MNRRESMNSCNAHRPANVLREMMDMMIASIWNRASPDGAPLRIPRMPVEVRAIKSIGVGEKGVDCMNEERSTRYKGKLLCLAVPVLAGLALTVCIGVAWGSTPCTECGDHDCGDTCPKCVWVDNQWPWENACDDYRKNSAKECNTSRDNGDCSETWDNAHPRYCCSIYSVTIGRSDGSDKCTSSKCSSASSYSGSAGDQVPNTCSD